MDKHYCKAARDCGCTLWDYGKVSPVCAEIHCLDYVLPKPITNADRIRAMSDEELAQTLNIAVCPPPVLPFTSCNEGQGCMKCWMNWLQQPAPEEDVNNGRPNL